MSSNSLDEIPPSATTIRPLRRSILSMLIALLVLCLAVRFVWDVSHTEIGWETVRQQWRDETLGWFTGSRVPIGCRPPAEQAEFWLAETERILAEEPNNAELAAAAALLLDSPGSGFEYRFLIPQEKMLEQWVIEGPPPEKLEYFTPRIDYDAIAKAMDDFEERCQRRCLAYAAKATELQPDEPRWWRLRALLLFRRQLYSDKAGPRDPRWFELLAECKKHDPDNALYDYLAAWRFWQEGVDTNSLDQEVTDKEKFQRGMDYFLKGQKKDYLAVGGDEPALVIEFLRHTKLPCLDYEGVAATKSILFRFSSSLRGLWRINLNLAEQSEQAGDLAEALDIRRRNERVFDQFDRSGDAIASDCWILFIHRADLKLLFEFLEKHQQLVSKEEFKQIKTAAEEAELNTKSIQEAGHRLAARQTPTSIPHVIVKSALAGAAAQSIVFLLIFGVGLFAILKFTGKNPLCNTISSILGLAVVWVCGYLLSFLVLGLAPAGIIPLEIQKLVVPIAISTLIAAAAGWVFWKTVVQSNFHYASRILITLALLCIATVGAVWTWGGVPSPSSRIVCNLYVPPRGWQNVAPGLLQQAFVIVCGRWNWALVQWMVYYGPLVGIGVSIGLLMLWGGISRRWSGVFAGMCRSALGVAILWIIVYCHGARKTGHVRAR